MTGLHSAYMHTWNLGNRVTWRGWNWCSFEISQIPCNVTCQHLRHLLDDTLCQFHRQMSPGHHPNICICRVYFLATRTKQKKRNVLFMAAPHCRRITYSSWWGTTRVTILVYRVFAWIYANLFFFFYHFLSPQTAISYICSTNLTNFLELFLQLPGIDVNKPDNEGNSPLHFAAQAGE